MFENQTAIRKRNKKMIEIISRQIVGDGIFPAAIPEVQFMRVSQRTSKTSVIYEPSVVIILQGQKRGVLGDKHFIYDPNQFLTLTVPLPFECETIGSESEPMIGIIIKLSPALIAEILLQMDDPTLSGDEVDVVSTRSLTMHQAGILVRLVESLATQESARILAANTLREFLYDLMRESGGDNIKYLALNTGKQYQIARILNQMHQHYADDFDMAQLARISGMSVSAFHTHFKRITQVTPLQYLKVIRLHKARMLMINDNMTASQAANRVGYGSNSQFSREFKRLFGEAPTVNSARIKRDWFSADASQP